MGEDRLTLWKSYLFSWRTKEAKFECLNMRGRMDFVNSFMSLTTKQSPLGPHATTSAKVVSSSILCGKLNMNVWARAEYEKCKYALVELLDKVGCGWHAVLRFMLDMRGGEETILRRVASHLSVWSMW